jgi:signal peptidase I
LPANTISLDEKAPLALAEQLLRTVGQMRFVARGGSMLPAILPGDELVVQRASLADISVGDVVLCSREGRWFAHRVYSVLPAATQNCLITRGDALISPDSPVFPMELLGRISFVVRGGQQRLLVPWQSISQKMLRAAVRHVPRFAGGYLRWRKLSSRLAQAFRVFPPPAENNRTERL